MKLLVVAFAHSIHTARYLRLLSGSGWEIHLFDSQQIAPPHADLPPLTLHSLTTAAVPDGVRLVPPATGTGRTLGERVAHLAEVVDAEGFDIVHSHEIQHGGALIDELRRQRPDLREIPWVVTNWGSDILWWGRNDTFVPRIRSVVSGCDYYGAECHRDVALARAFGLRGKVIGVWPVAGGLDLDHARALRAPGPTSGRRTLAVKGAVNEVSRGHVAFEAVRRCGDLLRDWEVATYQLDADLGVVVDELADEFGFVHRRLSDAGANTSAHDELLRMHGRARVSLGLNVTDALSTSFLEALAMGSFPVQSSSSCGNELTPVGRGALFVPAEDPGAVASALRRALTDDELVDAATPINERVAAEHLDTTRTRARVLDAYERILVDHEGPAL
jgi:glycosyltransferase involved in cell wall biosynthesis